MSGPPPTLDLPALAALAEKATPGPWERPDTESSQVEARGELVCRMNDEWEFYARYAENASYIAAADPTTILALIRRVQKAEAIVEDARLMRDVISGMVSENASAETMRGQCRLLVQAFDQAAKAGVGGT